MPLVVILEQRDELLSLLSAQSKLKSEAMSQKTLYMQLKEAKIERAYWNGRVRMDTASLSATTKKAAEVELICAQLEAQIRDGKAKKENTEFSQTSQQP